MKAALASTMGLAGTSAAPVGEAALPSRLTPAYLGLAIGLALVLAAALLGAALASLTVGYPIGRLA